uniref:Uncharacterized protein n=1 Tax=Oryza brachyantha TaxID=4533 RepID=J3L089_ORYBR
MATAWCRVWWPRGRLQPVPPARFVLFGWLFARTSSVDVVVATALLHEEILLSFPTLEALQLELKASQLLEPTKLSELRMSIARSLSELEMFTEEGERLSTARRKMAINETILILSTEVFGGSGADMV